MNGRAKEVILSARCNHRRRCPLKTFSCLTPVLHFGYAPWLRMDNRVLRVNCFVAEACNAECKIISGRGLWCRDFEGGRVRAERGRRAAAAAIRLPRARPGRVA